MHFYINQQSTFLYFVTVSPECIALKTDSEFRCQCTANPPVDEYHFLVDGNYHEGHVLDVSNIVDTTDVVCYGQNVIGTGRSEALSMVSQIGKSKCLFDHRDELFMYDVRSKQEIDFTANDGY